MSNYAKLYWLTRIDSIQGLSIALLVVSLAALIMYFIIGLVENYDNEDWKEYSIRFGIVKRVSVPSIIFSIIFLLFVPTKNEVIFIVAGGKTIDFIQSDTSINKLPVQTTEIISNFMQNQIENLKENKK